MGKKVKYSCGRTIAEKSAPPSLSYVDKKANIILENVTCLTGTFLINFWELTFQILQSVLAIPFQMDTVSWAIEGRGL